MAVYQVSVVFDAVNDGMATKLATKIQEAAYKLTEDSDDSDMFSEVKIAFTKFEQEAENVSQ